MNQFYLERVSRDRKSDIIEYIEELYKYNSRINGVGQLQDYVTKDKNNFEEWFVKIENEANSTFAKICYLFIRKTDNRLIGMVNIRMNEDLKDYKYGHVGYSIRPTEQNKGYGKLQFYSALKKMKNNNINKCQMVCEKTNDISRKIIQSLGGTFDKSIGNEEYYSISVDQTLEDNSYKYDQYLVAN